MMSTRLKCLLVICLLSFLTACVAAQKPKDPWASMRQPDGTVIWMEELNFTPPPKPWRILDLSETDFSLAFFSSCINAQPGNFPCEATIAYAGEPFGYSQDLRKRQKEFFKRFLWASRLDFQEPELEDTTLDGREALIADIIGTEPSQGHQVKSKVFFVKRGERVEAFFMNQWRAPDATFDLEQFSVFEQFVKTFKYVRPSFYELLDSKPLQLKGE